MKHPSGTRELLAELRQVSVSGRLTGMTERPVLLLDLRLVLLERKERERKHATINPAKSWPRAQA